MVDWTAMIGDSVGDCLSGTKDRCKILPCRTDEYVVVTNDKFRNINKQNTVWRPSPDVYLTISNA